MELARRLIDGDTGLPDSLQDTPLRELAWAIKETCYAAWSSEPRRAARCAEVLAQLSRRVRETEGAEPLVGEIAALADWTEGIARIAAGRMAEAVARFETAAAGFRALGQVQRAAETQVPKIMALSMLGQHREAVECAESTREDFLAAGDLRAAATTSLNLGNVLLHQGSYAKAARHYREAAVHLARVGDAEHSVMADIGLARALAETGEFEEALRTYARAGMRAQARGFGVLAAMVEESVALLHLVRGRYSEALAGLEGSRRRYETLALPQHLAVAEKHIADAYLELRLLPEALSLYERALADFRSLAMPQEQAWSLAQIGRTRALMGQPAAAGAALIDASNLFAEQGNAAGAASAGLARAELASAEGDNAGALALATEAARAFAEAALPEGDARAQVVRARALFALGELERARALLADTLVQARQRQLLPVQLRCLSGQGLVAAATGDATTAGAAFESAIELFEVQRQALPGDEIRSAFLTDHLIPYRELLRLALARHDAQGGTANAADVLRQLERFRARSWSDRLAGTASAEVAPEADALRARLNWLYRKLRRSQQDGQPGADLLSELRRTEQELLERIRRARLTAAALPGAATVGDGDFDRELREALGADGALVEYGVIDDELFACIVTGSEVFVRRRLAKWSEATRLAQSARFQLETLRFGAARFAAHAHDLERRARVRMQQLHEKLWSPIGALLRPYRRIVVVPHAQLWALPFGALHDGACYLAQQVQLAIAPSARIALHGMALRPGVPKQALALGDSATLAHAAREAQFVAGLFPEGHAAVGADATIATVLARAGPADVIHLACHAQFRADSPMFSALHLHDGALTVEAVQRLALRAGVVVLSACETGLAESGSGDEMVGLVRAFLLAGAARVVASLWPVDDAATATFMRHFYSALCGGQGAALALSSAQDAVLQEAPHPYYWAGFGLYGGF